MRPNITSYTTRMQKYAKDKSNEAASRTLLETTEEKKALTPESCLQYLLVKDFKEKREAERTSWKPGFLYTTRRSHLSFSSSLQLNGPGQIEELFGKLKDQTATMSPNELLQDH